VKRAGTGASSRDDLAGSWLKARVSHARYASSLEFADPPSRYRPIARERRGLLARFTTVNNPDYRFPNSSSSEKS
jgi:hypothetical protein